MILTTLQQKIYWWRVRDSNPRPRRCERRALPTELTPRGHERAYSTSRFRAVPALREGLEQRAEEIERQREKGGRGPLRRDLAHGLQIPELDGDRMPRENLGRVGQLRRRLKLAVGVDDLGPPLALGLRLLGHRALHVLGEVDLLDLHRRHLDAPGLGVLVDDPLELLVDLVARREEVVELDLAEHAPERRLRDLRGRVEVVLHRDDRPLRIHDTEVDDRADLERHVVAGDHVLGRHVERDRLKAHLDHPVDERHEQDEPWPVAQAAGIEDGPGAAPEPEDDGPLVLAQDLRKRADEEDDRKDHHEDQQRVDRDHGAPPFVSALATFSVSPSTATTRTRAPASTGSPSATARQISPCTKTCPSGASRSLTVAVCPTRPLGPRSCRRERARTPAVITKRKSPAVAPTVGTIAHHDTRNPISGASNSISEPSAIETMPPIASTPWLTILISATSRTIPNRIRSRPA